MTQQEVIAKILDDMSKTASAVYKLASDYALETIAGKREDKQMNEDTAKRYLAKYDTWKEAMSIVSKYDSQR
jgi:hypothetical protein